MVAYGSRLASRRFRSRNQTGPSGHPEAPSIGRPRSCTLAPRGIRPYTRDATEGGLAIEAGTPGVVRRDPCRASCLGWSPEGHTGTVVRTERVDSGAIYYVSIDGKDGVTLAFRWVHHKESG